MNFWIAIVFGIIVAALIGGAYALAIRRIPGKQPGEEALDAAIDRITRLGFRVEAPTETTSTAPPVVVSPAVVSDQPGSTADGIVPPRAPPAP